MKIENVDYSIIQDPAVQRVESNTAQRQEAVRRSNDKGPDDDSVNLSSTSRQIDSLRDIVNSAPDVRADKVQALKAAVQNGTYDVRSQQIADKIISADASR